jgi:hypothetical protein
MSVILLATTFFDRLRTRARSFVPDVRPANPAPETPHQQRERLRHEALARGGVLADIETIKGDCPAQTARQIRDLTRWLDERPASPMTL